MNFAPFQIGRTVLLPLVPLDVDLSKRTERRAGERRAVEDVLNRAHSEWQDKRFDRRIADRRQS